MQEALNGNYRIVDTSRAGATFTAGSKTPAVTAAAAAAVANVSSQNQAYTNPTATLPRSAALGNPLSADQRQWFASGGADSPDPATGNEPMLFDVTRRGFRDLELAAAMEAQEDISTHYYDDDDDDDDDDNVGSATGNNNENKQENGLQSPGSRLSRPSVNQRPSMAVVLDESHQNHLKRVEIFWWVNVFLVREGEKDRRTHTN